MKPLIPPLNTDQIAALIEHQRQTHAFLKNAQGATQWWNWWSHKDLKIILPQIEREIDSEPEQGSVLTITFE